MKKDRRSNRIIMTNEARVLRDLRISNKLSMRKAGELVGKSDSYIAHVETGRMDPPVGEKLDRLLVIYGGMKQKSFYERVRKINQSISPKQELESLLDRTTDEQILIILKFVKAMLAKI